MAVGVMSSIGFPYKREHTIDDSATVKNGEAVFTHSSPRSSAPGAASASSGDQVRESHGASDRVARATPRLGLKGNVQVRGCAQPCHSADVYRREGVLKWLKQVLSFFTDGKKTDGAHTRLVRLMKRVHQTVFIRQTDRVYAA